MARRSQMEIYMDILKAVANGRRKPTHIMYRANLCWERLKKPLNFLVKQGLLEKTNLDGSVTFSLALKGKDVLTYFNNLQNELYHKKKILPTEVYAHYK